MKNYSVLLAIIVTMVIVSCNEKPKEKKETEEKIIEKEAGIATELSDEAYVDIWAKTLLLTEKHMINNYADDPEAYSKAFEELKAGIEKIYDEYNTSEEAFKKWANSIQQNHERYHEMMNNVNKRIEEIEEKY